jgi:hypothetical protein
MQQKRDADAIRWFDAAIARNPMLSGRPRIAKRWR